MVRTQERGIGMLYRAIFGLVPMLIIALFASGAIPISGVLPGSGPSVAQVSGKAGGSDAPSGRMGPVRNGREVVAEGLGRLYGVRPDQASLMQEEFGEIETEMRKEAAERRSGIKREGWQAKGSGWGRQPN